MRKAQAFVQICDPGRIRLLAELLQDLRMDEPIVLVPAPSSWTQRRPHGVRARWRRAYVVKQPTTYAPRWPGEVKLLLDGHYVQTTAPHGNPHVFWTDDAPVHVVAGVLQRRSHLVELIATVYPKSICDVLQQDNSWALRSYIF